MSSMKFYEDSSLDQEMKAPHESKEFLHHLLEQTRKVDQHRQCQRKLSKAVCVFAILSLIVCLLSYCSATTNMKDLRRMVVSVEEQLYGTANETSLK